MKYSLPLLMREVRILLDENDIADSLLSEQDPHTLTLNDIIEQHLLVAAKSVLVNAPLFLVGDGAPLDESVEWESEVGRGMCFLRLPDDFLRLICFRMSDWQYAVNQPISCTDKLYSRMRSRYRGVSGNPQRPVAVLCPRDTGLYLECYSCSEGESVKVISARYLPNPVIVEGNIELPERLKSAILYLTAGLVLQSIGEMEKANVFITTSKSFHI